jgi:hypothetical protein
LLHLGINVVDGGTENGDLLDEVLKGYGMNCVPRGTFHVDIGERSFLFLRHFLHPDIDNLLEPASSEITQRSMLPQMLSFVFRIVHTTCLDQVALELQPQSQLLDQRRELIG